MACSLFISLICISEKRNLFTCLLLRNLFDSACNQNSLVGLNCLAVLQSFWDGLFADYHPYFYLRFCGLHVWHFTIVFESLVFCLSALLVFKIL